MERKELICIGCPLGCPLTVSVENGVVSATGTFCTEEGECVQDKILTVRGNTCKRGEIYGIKEVTNPTRIVTSTIRILEGEERMLPVKTKADIPKGKIAECIRALKEVKVHAPVILGEVIIADVAGTGVDIVAAKTVNRK